VKRGDEEKMRKVEEDKKHRGSLSLFFLFFT